MRHGRLPKPRTVTVPAEAFSWLVVASLVAGCGGQTTGTGTHVDVGTDASTGGYRNGSGGAGASSGGSSGSGLVDAGIAASFDAGPCLRTTPPACSQNTYPPCAPDWPSALSWFTACGFTTSGASVAHCGPYNAVVVTGFDNGNTYFYDAPGKLIGSQNSYSCEAYGASFVPLAPLALNSCSPLHPCPSDAGTLPCSSQTCGMK